MVDNGQFIDEDEIIEIQDEEQDEDLDDDHYAIIGEEELEEAISDYHGDYDEATLRDMYDLD